MVVAVVASGECGNGRRRGKGRREEALKKDFSGSPEEGWRRVGAAAVWAPLATPKPTSDKALTQVGDSALLSEGGEA